MRLEDVMTVERKRAAGGGRGDDDEGGNDGGANAAFEKVSVGCMR